MLAPIKVALPLSLVAVLVAWFLGHLLIGLALVLVFVMGAVLVNRPKAHRLYAGMQGEKRAFAQLLRVPDAAIFNDVMLERENADQIVVTREGVFTVEVKNWAEVLVSRHGVTSRGEGRPQVIQQARRQSGKLAALIRHKVCPIIVFTSPSSRVLVREVDGVAVCHIDALAATVTRLRREAVHPLNDALLERTIDILERHLES